MAHLFSIEKAWIFRITDVRNVSWVLRNGLHSQNSGRTDPDYVRIGNQDLIASRASRCVPIAPYGALADYIPFYFTPYSMMMYNITTGYRGIPKIANYKIAIMVASLHEIAKSGTAIVYTDRHAYLRTARFFSSMDHLDEIDWEILRNRDFRRDLDDPEKTSRYQSEALIFEQLAVEQLTGIVCHDESARQTLEEYRRSASVEIKIVVHPQWYF